MDCKTVRHLIGTDLERYAQENNLKITLAKKISFFFLPCILVLAFQRISHYFFLKVHYLTARLIYTINLILFAADISPNSSLGSHAYLPHPVGIVIIGKVGDYCTLFANITIGGGREEKDIGAGMGLPLIGNHVMLGAGSRVLGAIKVGDRVQVGAASLVITDVPEDSNAYGVPAKIQRRQ